MDISLRYRRTVIGPLRCCPRKTSTSSRAPAIARSCSKMAGSPPPARPRRFWADISPLRRRYSDSRSGLPKPLIPYIDPPSLGPRGGVVTRRSAKPFTRVRVPTWPPSQAHDIIAQIRFSAFCARPAGGHCRSRPPRVCTGFAGNPRFSCLAQSSHWLGDAFPTNRELEST